jgi:hypothetical protein
VQHRLQLLREEYVKLQHRLAEVERENSLLAAGSGKSGSVRSGKSFAAEILRSIADLLNNENYRWKIIF